MKAVERVLLIGVAVFTFCFTAQGQDTQGNPQTDDDDIASSIAPYPADVREAILNVSQYPQKLVKIERVQARSSQSFQDLLASYPRATQEKFYNLARYPELIRALVADGPKSSEQVKTLTASYPAEVGTSAADLYPAHVSELKAMDKKYGEANDAMENIISSLPAEAQQSMRKIVGMPDVMNLLTDRIDLTVSLGEAYKNDPDAVRQDLDKLHTQLASENEKELNAYKEKVARDPELQSELKKSAQDFANNYSDAGNSTPTVINNYYNTNPYPYWFGYPYWYPTAMWYPRPLYYHTGFYIGAGGNMVILGLPSYGYSNWFCHYGYRHYPRMYGWYNGYYASYHAYRPGWSRGYSSVSRERYYNRTRNSYRSGGAYNNYGTNGRTRPTENTGTRGMQSSRERFNNTPGNQNPVATQDRNSNSGNRYRSFSSPYSGSNNQQRFNGLHSQQFQQQGNQRLPGGSSFQRGSGNGMQRSFNGGGGATRGSFGGGHGGGGNGGHSRGRN